MNENENSTVVTDEDWGDIDLSDLTDEEVTADTEVEESTEETEVAQDGETESEVDQPSEGEAETDTESDTQPVEEFVLKHLDETRTVNRDEVIKLAQQGLDYTRIKDKLRDAEAAKADVSEKLSFFEKLAENQGKSLDEFIEMTAASLRADEKKISYDEALREVKFEAEKAKFAKEKSNWEASKKVDNTADEAREADITAFMERYPEAAKDPQAIPKEVWKEAENTGLTQAYTNYLQRQKDAEIASLRKQLEQEKQYKKNKESSTGSQATDNSSSKDAEFDALWAD